MGEQDCCDSPTVKTKRFIGVEYDGRKSLIQRNPSYEATIEFIKIAFKALQPIPTDRLAISAYIEEFDDTLELSEHVWGELLPELKYITVILVGPTPETPGSEENAIEPETETPNEEPASEEAPADPPADAPEEPPQEPLEEPPEDLPSEPPAEAPTESETPDSDPAPETPAEPEMPGGFPACDGEPEEESLPFADLVLCFTGMSSRSRIALFEKAEALGAMCDNNLTNRTTHLVAAAPEGAKYQWALKLNLPVLSLEWIPDTYARWLAGEAVDCDESIRTHMLIPPE